ncbi:MAG TPA: nuclear transport factor 2 family protein [Mycobacterium sp.]|nr:nuclear transport factor 2 family protein [Mycobacterium sp.]
MTPIERLADRLAITDLLYRYAELIDAGDFDGVGQLLARCAVGAPDSPVVTGAAAIAALYAATTRRYPGPAGGAGAPRTRHLVLNPIVEVGDGTATARSTFCVVQGTDAVPLQPIVVGRYYDTFGRDDAGWFFTARRMDVEFVGDTSGHLLIDLPGSR